MWTRTWRGASACGWQAGHRGCLSQRAALGFEELHERSDRTDSGTPCSVLKEVMRLAQHIAPALHGTCGLRLAGSWQLGIHRTQQTICLGFMRRSRHGCSRPPLICSSPPRMSSWSSDCACGSSPAAKSTGSLETCSGVSASIGHLHGSRLVPGRPQTCVLGISRTVSNILP